MLRKMKDLTVPTQVISEPELPIWVDLKANSFSIFFDLPSANRGINRHPLWSKSQAREMV